MNRKIVQFTAPFRVDTVEGPIPEPGDGEVLISSLCSAISSGTEMLAYRGQLPAGQALDESIEGMERPAQYPLRYGYSIVGSVIASKVNKTPPKKGQRVFAFHPHESHFATASSNLILIPDDVETDDAVFLANMETAVGLLMDGKPLIGERVLIVGAGVVGLLTTALLTRYPQLTVDVVDLKQSRLARAKALGASGINTPYTLSGDKNYDLVYELSGNPGGLQLALEAAGYAGRVIVGSWYGNKPVSLDLGGRFHRSKLNVYASQVSRLDPEFAGRWTKQRRMDVALQCLKTIRPGRFITHAFDVEKAAEAYQMLEEETEDILQVVLNYG